MRDHGAPIEPSAVRPGNRFPLAGGDFVTGTWSDTSPAGEFPQRLDKAKTTSAAMLLLGVALLFFVPLGGALLLVTGGLGLAISSEAPMGGPATAPSITTNATTDH